VRFERLLNAFVLDDRAVYFSPIPAQSAALLARALDEDSRVGVSIAPLELVYGQMPRDSDLAADLMLADRFLAMFVYPGGCCYGYRLPSGFEPKRAPYGKATVLFTFKEFEFAIEQEELRLTRANFDASIVPLAAQRAADGGNLPDLDAISAGVFTEDINNAIFNARQLGENFNYFRRELIVDRTLAYGEVAALFRALSDAGGR